MAFGKPNISKIQNTTDARVTETLHIKLLEYLSVNSALFLSEKDMMGVNVQEQVRASKDCNKLAMSSTSRPLRL
jgi:hypothetical protein